MTEVTSLNRPTPGLPEQRSKAVADVPGARMSTLVDSLMEFKHEETRTLFDVVKRGARLSESGECLGARVGDAYEWMSYEAVAEQAGFLGSGLISTGLPAGQSSKVGIFSQNRSEYVLTEYACYTYSMILVPLYATLGDSAVDYIISHTGLEFIVVDNEQKVEVILKLEAAKMIKGIIHMNDIRPETRERVVAAGIQIMSFSQLLSLGEQNRHDAVPPSPSDTCVICYTSGTTGTPKGVILSHVNQVAVIASMEEMMREEAVQQETYFSYLPLAHSYERFALFSALNLGARIAFLTGDISHIMNDVQLAKPTIFCAVPRMLNRLYDKVNATVENGGFIKRNLFRWMYSKKLKNLNKGIRKRGGCLDGLVFGPIQKQFGGRVRIVTTGSAPIAPDVMDFCRIVLNAQVLEGYGQTESAGASTAQLLGETRTGNIGPPIPSIMIKLVDVPEMGYLAENNQGEICMKGPSVFCGYYNSPEKTAEALDDDEWLHSGDIGQWDEDWSLKIIDRKKNLFKLAQGEYVAPEKIECVYVRSQAVAQMFVYGESLKSSLVGIAFVDPENIQYWAEVKVGVTGSIKELCNNEEVNRAVLDDLLELGRKSDLKSFEQVKKIHLHPEQMSIENNLLTPTLKTKRADVERQFKSIFEELYSSLN